MFESHVYAERRRRLRAAMGDAVILIYGHAEAPRNYRANTTSSGKTAISLFWRPRFAGFGAVTCTR
jgi:hypothetical protein